MNRITGPRTEEPEPRSSAAVSWRRALSPTPVVLVICVLSVPAVLAAPQELQDSWGNLEGAWRFRTDPGEAGEAGKWHLPEFDDSTWRTLKVPGYWEPQGVTDPRPGEAPKPKNGMPWTDYDGVAWYRLRFVVPAAWANEELVLYLGSIDDEDRTYFNGRLVGETGPGVGRAVTLSRQYRVPAEVVRPGAENLLAIRVKDGGGPGGVMGPVLFLLPKEKLNMRPTLPQGNRPLSERFANPPAHSRILKIVHNVPDAPMSQDILLRSLADRGFGGIVTNVSFNDYLTSETKWAAFTRTVNEAKRMGMAQWLYDERGYPSGNAGGHTMRNHPEWQARGLLIADTVTEGGPGTLALPPGELMLAAAFPQLNGGIDLEKSIDLSGQVKDGQLTWHTPDGSWHVMAITESFIHEGTHAAVSLADKLPYINLLMPEPTARFIELTHDAYAERLDDDLGKWFTATFTDEPSLMSMFMQPQPHAVLPWAPNLPGAFEERHGYALEPVIPGLVADAGPRGPAVRYAFWDTVAELVSENYFGQLQTWCRAHNLHSGGHLLLEEPFLTHVPLYGDLFRCARRVDAPSIDCLTSIPENVPWFVARLFSSVAELEGRTVTMCETSDHQQRYRPPGDKRPVRNVTEDEIRGTCNHLILNGITTITSYYSFNGLEARQLVRLNEWVGRCSTTLEGGHQVSDVALLYPIETAWVHFEPSRRWTDDAPAAARRIAQVYRTAAESLYASQRDATFVDARALAEALVDDGVLRHGNLAWRVVVLPCADTLPMKAWKNLARFWETGGAVIALTALPANSETAFPSPEVEAIAARMFGAASGASFNTNDAGGMGAFLPAGSEALLPYVVDACVEPDVLVDERGCPIRVTHRRIDNHEVYFAINSGNAPWSGKVSFAATGQGEQWDPATGAMAAVDGPEGLDLNLGPYGGMLYRFAEARASRRADTGDGRLPRILTTPLPAVTPRVGKGEFVDGGVEPSEADGLAWHAEARITKSEVDTFLFIGFTFAEPVDFGDAVCLAVESWVPEGQDTATPLRIILRDADGREYIANSARPLDVPGRFRCLVPFSQFRPAGWRKAPPGNLDRSAIAGVNIGWGGYLGTEGETVAFAIGNPLICILFSDLMHE